MSMFTLAISCLTTSNLPWFVNLTFQVTMQYRSYSIGLYFHSQTCPQMGLVSALAQPLYSFWNYFSTLLLPTWGVHLSVSYLFSFSYCSWGSQGKKAEVVCRSFLQWTTFYQNSPPSPSWVALCYMAHSFIELTNLDSVLKSRDITFLTKVHIVKALVFLVVIYRGVSWTIK